MGLPHVRAVRPALDRHDLPDDVPEDAAQRAVRRGARGRPLRGRARDDLRVADGVRPLREMPLLPRRWRQEFNHLRPPVDNQLRGDSSWVNLVTGRDREMPPGWAAVEAPTTATSRARSPAGRDGREDRHRRDAAVRHRWLRRGAGAPGPARPVGGRDQRDRQRGRARARSNVAMAVAMAGWAPSRSCRSSAATRTGSPCSPTSSAPSMFGVENICCLTGDDVTAGDEPQARRVFDLDGPQLVRLATTLSQRDVPVRPPAGPAAAPCSSARSRTRPRRRSPTAPSGRVKKLQAGARFLQLQICFHPGRLEAFMREAVALGLAAQAAFLPTVCLVARGAARCAFMRRARARHRRAGRDDPARRGRRPTSARRPTRLSWSTPGTRWPSRVSRGLHITDFRRDARHRSDLCRATRHPHHDRGERERCTRF